MLTQAFMLSALVLGGAGVSGPFVNATIVLLGLAVLAIRIPRIVWASLDKAARIAAWLLMASAALCVIQVLPLPKGLWGGLPGHALAAQVATTLGGGGWAAWSLAPDRTLDCLASLVPATAAIVVAAQASSDERLAILRLVVIVALVSAVLAVVQIAAGPGSAPLLFATRHSGFGVGFFVNRNHLALFLLLAMLIVALPGVPMISRKVEDAKALEWGLRTAALVLLLLGVLSTLSRTGIFLAPIALVGALLLCRRSRVKLPVLVGGIAAAGLLAFVLRSAPPIQMLFARYSSAAEDKRFEYWANTLDALRDALPLGTGLGTFTLVYPTYEPLVEVRPDVVNHAHNDLLELVLEAGLPGAALLVAWLALIGFAVARARATAVTRRQRLLPLAVAIGTGLALAASVVDYPLRMYTISVTLGLLVGMLISRPAAVAAGSVEGRGNRAKFSWIVALPLVPVGLWTLSSHVGQQLVRLDKPEAGAIVAPWSSRVQADAASRYQLLGDVPQSSRAARRALALSPLEAPALRAEGMAQFARGEAEHGAALMSLGARLGWRDGFTQLWLIEQAIAADAPAFAVQRIDAVLRQDKFSDELLPYLPTLMPSAQGRSALAEQLSFAPGWRVAFFNAVARDRTWAMSDLTDLARRLAKAGSPVRIEDTALIRSALAAGGRFADVRSVWRMSGCATLVGNGDFEAAPGTLPQWAGPYHWFAPKLTGVRLAVADPEVPHRGRAVSVMSDGLAPGAALVQTVALQPGRYRLSVSAIAADAALTRQIRGAIECRIDTDTAQGAPADVPLSWQGDGGVWQAAKGTFSVPGDCPGQNLMLFIPQTNGKPYSFWLDDVSIRPAP